MAPKKKAKHVTTRPLRCAKCKTTDVTVSGVQQMLRRDGRSKGKREYARVTCDSCGHEFWSRHPEALKISRQVDKTRAEDVGQPHAGT